MAKHFYSFQYDLPFRPTYLRNWEVPKTYCPKPRRRIGMTKIIANSRGHLLPGVSRPPCNPFGDFIGTWIMPNRITRETANKLNGLANKKEFLEKCARIASAPPRPKPKLLNGQNEKEEIKEEIQHEDMDKDKELEEALQNEIDKGDAKERIICPIHDF